MTDHPVGATATTFRVVEELCATGEAGVTELSDRLDLSKSAVHNHLTTLEQLGLVVGDDGSYRLGLRFVDLGMTARDHLEVVTTGRPMVASLAEQADALASIVVPEHGMAAYAYVSTDDGGHVRPGTHIPLHADAGGKVVLAFWTAEERQEYADEHGLLARTERTITGRSELRNELRSVKDRGLAFDRGEAFADVRSVAAPVRDTEGTPVAAVSVSGPAERLSGKRLEEDLAGLVLSTANDLELALRP